MLRVTLSHAYFLNYDRKQRERRKPYPPLATLQVATLIRDRGHQVSLFDSMLSEGVKGFEENLARHDPQLCIIYEDNFNFLSKMCLGKMRAAACEMISSAKRRGAMVVVSGSDASDCPDPYLDQGADIVVLGEGIAALLTIVERLDNLPHMTSDELTAGLEGIVFKTASGVVQIPANLAKSRSVPVSMPAWDLVDIDLYRRTWQSAHGFFSLNMASSRGCSFKCNWCAKPIWGNSYIQRDARDVADEMNEIKRRYAPDHIWFADDIFGMRPEWISRFAFHVRNLGASIPFTIQSRADLLGDKAVGALRDAGCMEIWIGAESGSQKILDAMDKGTTVGEVQAARKRLRKAGIRACFFIQLGYLGETLSDILDTRRLVRESIPDDIGVSVSYPLPGTKFYEKVSANLGSKVNWDESNDLAMMFQGTYNSDFYRTVRDLLHDENRLQNRQSGGDQERFEFEMEAVEARWRQLIAEERNYRLRRPPILLRKVG
jgi:anaerobic magnesium-protoporphyrin IX monomethyl ester cyclase